VTYLGPQDLPPEADEQSDDACRRPSPALAWLELTEYGIEPADDRPAYGDSTSIYERANPFYD
jgi:hypothetical protein